ncbi:MAG: polysaccharide biosynthesis tyrosine autokinase [Propionibacteriaceae bacterium]|nr:polysaccharide biosynthesis tyrosine autokinase [Propionibacteriaceae bacterium]
MSATVIDEATIPTQRTRPRPTVNLAAGAILGVTLGVGQALLRSILDTRIRTVEDITVLSEAPMLGVIGQIDSQPAARQTKSPEQWVVSEEYRRLRTNVGFVGLGGERRPSLVITSSVQGEGKTETSVNLARVLAQAGETVLLVDADLRRPQVGARMSLDSELGLSDVLTGRGTLRDLIIQVGPSFAVLPSGTIPPNPSELLGSEAMAHLVAAAEREFDHVLFDAPPLLPVTDAVVLSKWTSGAIVVARSGHVKRTEFDAAQQLLETAGVRVLGLVLNDVPAAMTATYGGY